MPEKDFASQVMETTCPHCRARFRITDEQLRMALGRVKCGHCQLIFNALQWLKSSGAAAPVVMDQALSSSAHSEMTPIPEFDIRAEPRSAESELDLSEVMYHQQRNRRTDFSPFFWFIGSVLLLLLIFTQVMYYQRYQWISQPQYQQAVLALCRLIPCDESQFSNVGQIKLLQRNLSTHPMIPNALMATGSFVNQAPFRQKLPRMLVSLFDIDGGLIANRMFEPIEYLQDDKNKSMAEINEPVLFRLEMVDPGVDALTYEFDFY